MNCDSKPDQEACVGCGQGPRKHGEGYCDRCWHGSHPEWCPCLPEVARLRAEVETLRGEVFARDGVIKSRGAELERLRGALEDISHLQAPLAMVADARRIANYALDSPRPSDDERRRCGRCFYDETAPTTAEHAMCEAEGGHQWTADASRETDQPKET